MLLADLFNIVSVDFKRVANRVEFKSQHENLRFDEKFVSELDFSVLLG